MDKEIELWLHDMVATIGWFVGNMKRGYALRLISRHSEITERSQPGTILDKKSDHFYGERHYPPRSLRATHSQSFLF
ncbi:MAG: hypothetical protein D3914_00380 [Candidatus Electrothrix sp. LOE2]|nr:hypothetical protein [Candidatus Electrothrix sp. LOE2]